MRNKIEMVTVNLMGEFTYLVFVLVYFGLKFGFVRCVLDKVVPHFDNLLPVFIVFLLKLSILLLYSSMVADRTAAFGLSL